MKSTDLILDVTSTKVFYYIIFILWDIAVKKSI